MKTDYRFDITALLPPITLFVVITAFLYPYLNFPIKFPVLLVLFLINGCEVLFTFYLKKKSGFDASHAWFREFIIFQFLLTLLWLFLAGYLVPLSDKPPRTEYVIYYILVFPSQWLLTLRIRQKMPSGKIHIEDIPDTVASLRNNRALVLGFQIILSLVFLFGFRLAKELPFIIQLTYWANLCINFILVIFLNHLLEEQVWTGHKIKNIPVFNWFRFPLILFFIIASLSILIAWNLPAISLGPLGSMILLIIRKLALIFIKKDKPIELEEPEQMEMSQPWNEMILEPDGSESSPVAAIGDVVIKMTIFLLFLFFLLLPLINFLFLGKKKKKAALKTFLGDLLETLRRIFKPLRKETRVLLHPERYTATTEKPAKNKRQERKKIKKGSVELLFTKVLYWGEKKGFTRNPAMPPFEYMQFLGTVFPDKAEYLQSAGALFNRYLYDKLPLDPKDLSQLKKLVPVITGK